MSLITPDFGLLFWMTLIFLIVFFLLAKFGFPIITGMVDKRSERINGSIAKAKEAEERLAGLAEEQARLIEQARLEQGRILKEASEARDAMIAKAKAEASQEASAILDNAKREIEIERESALNDIRREVAELGLQVAEKVIRKELDSDSGQKDFIDRILDEMPRTN